MATKRLLDILWQRMLIYIQEVIWIGDQGEGTLLSGTLRFSYFRTSFSFSLWLGEWDHFTRRTETFQKISNMYGYFFVHITLHEFSVNSRTWGEGGKMLRSSAQGVDPPVCRVLDVAGKMLRSSAQGVDPPVCRVLDVAATHARDSSCLFRRGGGGQTGWHRAYSFLSLALFGPLTGFPAVSLSSL